MVVGVQAPGRISSTLLRGVRVRPFGADAPDLASMLAAAGVTASMPDVVLVPVAVEPSGRRDATAHVIEDALPSLARARAAGVPVTVVLDHAGPAAALWSTDRPKGPSDVEEPRTGRRPRPLDEAEWEALAGRYEEAARSCAGAGVPCVLGVDDDGLLHAALSPRTSPRASDEERLGRLLAIHAAASRGAGAPIDVVLVVEELCPRGLDPTDGIAAARALAGQGVRRIYASAGTEALPALRHREKGRTAAGSLHALATAAWLPARLASSPVEVVAVIPGSADGALEAAARLGLAGVVSEER